MSGSAESPLMKHFIGYIWIGDGAGIRLSLDARSAAEAMELVEAEYGEGHPFSIWNEEDASRPRGCRDTPGAGSE